MATSRNAPYKLLQHKPMPKYAALITRNDDGVVVNRKFDKPLGNRQKRKLGLIGKPDMLPLPNGKHAPRKRVTLVVGDDYAAKGL